MSIQSTYTVTMSPWHHTPGYKYFTLQPYNNFNVPPCSHATKRSCHRATIPMYHLPLLPTVLPVTLSYRGTFHTVLPSNQPQRPTELPATSSNRPTSHYHFATMSPWHLVRHRGSVTLSYRHVTFDTSAHSRTPTHLASFTRYLTFVNNTFVFSDNVCFVLLYVLLLKIDITSLVRLS